MNSGKIKGFTNFVGLDVKKRRGIQRKGDGESERKVPGRREKDH
jgi:hypothetical protein